MRTETYIQLVDLKAILKPSDEFMCFAARARQLYLAADAVQASVKLHGEFCLQTHWENINGYSMDQFPFTCDEYQSFRLAWLDRLIEEYK